MSGEHDAWVVTVVIMNDPPIIQYKGPYFDEKVAQQLADAYNVDAFAFLGKTSIPHKIYKRMKAAGMK